MSTKTIVVVGVTGSQGGSVGDVFLKEPGYKVRGLTRNTNSEAAQKWTSKGVEMVSADINDLSSLKKAFSGANVIFGVTDFWTVYRNPQNAEKASSQGITLNEYAYNAEVQQGKNIVDAAAAVLKEEGKLERLVLSTLTNSREQSKGRIQWNYHFDAKWVAVEHLRESHPELNEKTNLVQAAMYVDNYRNLFRKQSDGSYLAQTPTDPDTPVPMIHARDDMGHFAKALVEAAPGKHLGGHRGLITFNEFARLFGKLSGKEARFQQNTVDDFDKMMPGGLGREFGDMFAYMSDPDSGYYGGDPTVIYPEKLGVTLPTIEDFLKGDLPEFLAGQ